MPLHGSLYCDIRSALYQKASGINACGESLIVLATPRRIERTDLPTPLQTVHPKSKVEVALGSTLAQLEKGAIGGTLEMGGGHKPMAACVLGLGSNPSIAVWQHIDFLRINVAVYFYHQAPYYAKMTRISTPPLLPLVNLPCLVCLSASDAAPSHAYRA
jgi:hypothetical protein